MSTVQVNRQCIELSDIWFDDTWTALASWPDHQDLIFLGGPRSDRSLLALSWEEQSVDEFLTESVAPILSGSGENWGTGQIALLSYDFLAHKTQGPSGLARVIRVLRSIVLDHRRKEAFLCEEVGWHNCPGQLNWPPAQLVTHLDLKSAPLHWQSSWSHAQYRDAVGEVLADIRRGRFYQLNLLLYWQTPEEPDRAHWLRQLRDMAGPFAAYVAIKNLQLVSFSPERLARTCRWNDSWWIETMPIKGTMPVSRDEATDKKLQNELMSSQKNEAELNIIIDLLRNDLQQICQPSSVQVLDRGSLQSFINVHHRVAHIRGQLKPCLNIASVVAALCPGGSITGAPKREVMQAIQEVEGRKRGWFMGNIMFRDRASATLDSSILIRTAAKQGQAPWEFAAGSGLVIKSDAEDELQEILAKAKVLAADVL